MLTELEKNEKLLAGENPHNRPRSVHHASPRGIIDGQIEVSDLKERELQIEKIVRKIVGRNPEYQDLLYR